ncbi:basic leucine zipper 63-like [Pyrus ussuriensis x Pyrus communis]|uniref:Basic leucine zipper 63-like n=1 Tax=Pyrus ussuriensis x Pyrus communis TaxID=2448454 RepID=A0A5N5I2R6_9ROSA|nr:basic leucine zipper 63-like [Pyrus ussuriensis x Pyrus communis]
MQPGEATGLHYLAPLSSSSPYPPHFSMSTQSNATAFQFNRFSSPLYNFQFPNSQLQEINNNPQQPSSFSSSTSDEADEQQLSLINERKQRRMLSNRESARRSRCASRSTWMSSGHKWFGSEMRITNLFWKRMLSSKRKLLSFAKWSMTCNCTVLIFFPSRPRGCPMQHSLSEKESSNPSITSSMDLLG